ncbi:MAG: hypothetical protein AB7V58_07090 [Solirubrobacterales bacterium]
MAMVVGAAAPAYGTTAKTVLSMALEEGVEPSGTEFGTLRGDTTVASQRYCEQKRKIEVFRDGKKLGAAESDRYGNWTFSLNPLQSGSYVAKTKKTRLPIGDKPFCSAATSKPLIVT